MFCRRSRARSDSSTSPAQPGGGAQLVSLPSGHSFDSPAAAERLAGYSRESPLPASPETDSGSESLRVGKTMPPEDSQDPNLSSLTSALREKMKVRGARPAAPPTRAPPPGRPATRSTETRRR